MRNAYLICFLGMLACTSKPHDQPSGMDDKLANFTSSLISNKANLWWARCLADVNGDGILDVVLQDNNGGGGWLGYLKGNIDGDPWDTVVVAQTSPNGLLFAAGDLEAGDLDSDGDLDLIGVEHPGEWSDADAPANLFWYEQDQGVWQVHKIGTIPSALKDIALGNLDEDSAPEIVTVTYNAETLSVFDQGGDKAWQLAWDLQIDNLHEGLDVGDLNGDGFVDIAANGYWMPNPGNLDSKWELQVVDSIWFNQELDHWARNATKVICRDVDDDGKAEVFISHSEQPGYPIARYDWDNDGWRQLILVKELPAAHSLQVVDLDQNGRFEVLTGVNRNRMINIAEEQGWPEPEIFPMIVLPVDGTSQSPDTLNQSGVYNLLSGDLESDGDVDLFRLTSHDEPDMWLMRNDFH